MTRAAIVLLPALLLVACAQDRPVRSERQVEAIDWNERGQAAARRGDDAFALASFRKALEINQSIEHADGVALELLNIAAVHRRMGERQQAAAALDAVLADTALSFSAERRAEAAYRKALLHLDGAETDAARALSQQALALCGACAAQGRILNLQARLALQRGQAGEAASLARQAGDINRKTGDVIEQANSLRLAGDAALASTDFTAARSAYEQALALDKQAGLGGKIARDLIGIGAALRGQGRQSEANTFFRRAHAVAQGAGDAVLAAKALAEVQSAESSSR